MTGSASRGHRRQPITAARLLVLRWGRESRAPLSTRRRAPAGVQYTVLCRCRSSVDGHNTVWGSPGNGLSEKCATATKQAVETPGGGRDHPRRTNASRHRRAASRSGGATSAERDGRPVGWRTDLLLAAAVSAAGAGAGAAISPGARHDHGHRTRPPVTGTGSGWTPHRNDFAGKPVIRVAL
jgi:hypothetical protein